MKNPICYCQLSQSYETKLGGVFHPAAGSAFVLQEPGPRLDLAFRLQQ